MWETTPTAVRNQIGRDEQLLWSGQPRQGVAFRSSDIFMIPFSLMWGGFAIFWEAMALFMTFKVPKDGPGAAALIFPLFGLPFVLMGLYMIFGRFIVDARRRANTHYGVTNQRIILITGLTGRQVKSLNLRTLSDVSLSEKPDQTGTITFGPTSPFAGWYGNLSWPGMAQTAPAFEMIPEAKKVYDLIRESQAKT